MRCERRKRVASEKYEKMYYEKRTHAFIHLTRIHIICYTFVDWKMVCIYRYLFCSYINFFPLQINNIEHF